MQFTNSFAVSLPPHQAWRVLLDVRRIAPCLPGAELTEMVDDRTFKGKVSVRLGPVTLAFAGTATLEDVDDVAHTARVKAAGKDAKGRGAANATARFSLVPAATGSTVTVVTDLVLSGMVAQYGRGAGMIQSVADQIIGQFAAALEAEIAKEKTVEPSAGDAAPAHVPPPVTPISGFALLWAALKDWLHGLLRGRRA